MAWAKGLALGAANVVAIAIIISVVVDSAYAIPYVVMFGGIPGLVAGAALGLLAGIIKAYPRTLRAVVIAVPAIGVVVGLGALFGCAELVPATSVPTILAALVLERSTRLVAPPPPIPVASLQRG